MKDGLTIKAVNGGNHFEIKRELSETVNRTSLEERLHSIESEIESLEETLDRLKQNRQIIVDALNKGKGSGQTTVNTRLI